MTFKMTSLKDNEKKEKDETLVHIFVQQMLVTRIFVATYTGRFYVGPLKAYRDVIQVSEHEKDVIRDMKVVRRRIDNFYKGNRWAAITEPGTVELVPGHCFWVKLENVPFGSYWFTIENVSFTNEMVLKVRIIRSVDQDSSTASIHNNTEFDWNQIKDYIFQVFEDTVTWHNTRESAKFIFVLIMTVGTALLYSLQYIGDYSIRFFREFNNFIKVMTPILLAVLDLISKTVGGFYILIAMLWRGQPPRDMYPALKAAPSRQFRPMRLEPHQRRPY